VTNLEFAGPPAGFSCGAERPRRAPVDVGGGPGNWQSQKKPLGVVPGRLFIEEFAAAGAGFSSRSDPLI
jgi:hypothetical protein